MTDELTSKQPTEMPPLEDTDAVPAPKPGSEPPAALSRSGQPDPGSGQPDSPTPSAGRQTDKTPPKEIRADAEQARNRAENQDFLRVIGMYGGSEVPPVYIANVTVGQDFVFGQRGGASAVDVFPPESRDSAEVSGQEIRKIKRVYRRPAAYPTALRRLQDKRCVVARGKPHIGKRAAAIQLALELSNGELPVWELSGEVDLTDQIKKIAGRPNTVYLIDGLLRERGRTLKSTEARAISKSLAEHNCYLITCARPDVPFPADWDVVEFAPPVVSAEVLLEDHLAYYSSLSSAEIQSAVAHPAIADVLNKGLTPLQADRLAYQLAEVLQAGQPPEVALRGLAAAVEDDVREWLNETEDDVEDSAFRMTLAAFNGARYANISAATQALLRRLRPEPDTKSKDDRRPAYVSPLKKKDPITIRLQKARARRTTRTEPTEYSDAATIEVVELEDPAYSAALLKYVWTEIDDWRQPLLDWLCDYAVVAPRDLRLRAAGAIGALAALDFDYIRAHVFRSWAFSNDDPEERRDYYQALSNALGVLIWDDTRAEDVLGLLRAWVDDGSEALKWAAARAYAQVGLRYPREAIQQWRRILESRGKIQVRLTESLGIILPHPLHMSVIDACVSLFLRATEFPLRLRPIYEQALDGLADWVAADEKDRTAEQVGLPLFVALTTIGYPPDDNSGSPDEWPPAMLYIVGTQPDSHYRRVLASLLLRALNHDVLSASAYEVLLAWTEAAERDHSARDRIIVRDKDTPDQREDVEQDHWLEQTLAALLKEMLNSPGLADWQRQRERGRLKTYLTNWAKRHKDPLVVAQRLLTTLQLT